jgi:HupE / UreJ protein
MRRALYLIVALTWPVAGHVMSMSSGDLTITGSSLHYELRMPLYEITHVERPDQVLLDHVRFGGARRISQNCHADPASDAYLCAADYKLAAPADEIDVECTLASATVPNHVHLLHATMGGKREEVVFDLSFTHTKLRFREANAGEIAVRESTAGLLRAIEGPVQLLFLGALVLAARSRRELIVLAAMFVVGQCASVAIVPLTGWQPATRFVEAAAALTVAYLAVEILLLPGAGARWMVAGVLGAFHGLYFLLFVQNTGYHAALVLGGAAAGQAGAIALLAYGLGKLSGMGKRVVPSCASALLVFGLAWFFLRLRG